jgi:hypothetical protein
MTNNLSRMKLVKDGDQMMSSKSGTSTTMAIGGADSKVASRRRCMSVPAIYASTSVVMCGDTSVSRMAVNGQSLGSRVRKTW